ncbi:LacI family DNA-binding transcriptional regulator [Streptomyces sp. AC495_CC817]|uniref:LacI family DNA-binding transcriptional regulator n=1 Tax=Streptomyces sp. AC495_CC817 TaxID=2823900 RepID=UPI001C280A76|nr:LacI family DNA-binding transcriptional regulator [Streptomyces sp. AC495_CC817]
MADRSDADEAAEDGVARSTENVTIYDVAKLAGVNPSTVSRALNRPGRVNAVTERRIRAAAESLNYHVNPMARALPTGRTSIVGLVVSDITNPVFFDVIRGAEAAATRAGYTLVLTESEESDEREYERAQRMLRMVDGMLLATPRMSDEQITALAAQKPVAIVNRLVDDVLSVVPDVQHGIAEAVRHLRTLGHTRIAYVPGPPLSWMARRRGELLAQRCEWAHIELVALDPVAPTVVGGRSAAVAVRDSGATAVFAYNDLIAIGLMQELVETGIRIPADISVVGFDDIFGADFTSPALTTVKSPLREGGDHAMGALLARVTDNDQPAGGFDLATSLVVRGSTGPAAR